MLLQKQAILRAATVCPALPAAMPYCPALYPPPQALHYKELEFVSSPQTAIEALIHINNQLRQPEAAVGVLTYAQKHLAMELKESWYEKLCR